MVTDTGSGDGSIQSTTNVLSMTQMTQENPVNIFLHAPAQGHMSPEKMQMKEEMAQMLREREVIQQAASDHIRQLDSTLRTQATNALLDQRNGFEEAAARYETAARDTARAEVDEALRAHSQRMQGALTDASQRLKAGHSPN